MPTTPAQRLFIISEDAAARDQLADLVEAGGFGKPLAFASVLDFTTRYDPGWCGCIVLDLAISAYDGLRLQRHQQKMRCRMSFVYVVMRNGQPIVVEGVNDERQLEAGTGGEVAGALLARLGDALREHADYCGKAASLAVLGALYSRTSRREREVMARMVQGRTSKEIGAALGVSPRTVEIYRSRVLRKMQADTIADLVHRWLLLEGGAGPRADTVATDTCSPGVAPQVSHTP